ncbi:hypothetical protein [Embleya sp. AB8]|uniref:hypothetical protein n=1 Tax=Embleya sp. AB8 TaxID=3156304 RepID=UPI003C730EDA
MEAALHELSLAHSRALAAHGVVIAELLDQLGGATGRPRSDVIQGVALEHILPPEQDHGM